MALKLGMTVARIAEEMTVAEMCSWEVYFSMTHDPKQAAPVIELATATPEQLMGLFS